MPQEAGFLQVVSHQHEARFVPRPDLCPDLRLRTFLELHDDVTDLLAETRVQRGQRLVEEEEGGARHHGAGQRHPVSLPSAEGGRGPVPQFREADRGQDLLHPPAGLAPWDPPDSQGKGHVLLHREMRKEHGGLVEVDGASSLRGKTGDVRPSDLDAPLVDGHEPGHRPQKGCLARARRADQHQSLPGPHLQRYPDQAGGRRSRGAGPEMPRSRRGTASLPSEGDAEVGYPESRRHGPVHVTPTGRFMPPPPGGPGGRIPSAP